MLRTYDRSVCMSGIIRRHCLLLISNISIEGLLYGIFIANENLEIFNKNKCCVIVFVQHSQLFTFWRVTIYQYVCQEWLGSKIVQPWGSTYVSYTFNPLKGARLFCEDNQAAVKFLQDHGILLSLFMCPKCHSPCVFREDRFTWCSSHIVKTVGKTGKKEMV